MSLLGGKLLASSGDLRLMLKISQHTRVSPAIKKRRKGGERKEGKIRNKREKQKER